ncbi:transposase [Paenibacillus thermotolerans]|uniref:transposase n=1 Tax=Paenibacillus thermotolerans TaxID=3027807 RepID=UPI00236749C4|nr:MULTISPECIES: transposase [unclassified Paenibacillus]
MKPLRHIAAILEPSMDKTSQTVEWEMQKLLDWVEITYTDEADAAMVKNLLSYSKGFWKGLFTCYDHYHVPRTNNDLERFFRATKTRHRRMTGLRSWNEHILRNGELVVLVDDGLKQENLIARFQMVDYADYRKQKDKWSDRLSDSVARKRFRRDPQFYLKNLENLWNNDCSLNMPS